MESAGLVGDSPLREGIVSGFLLILFSELGDKTFFIAVLLALKENKGLVFAGSFGALAVMTIISVRWSGSPNELCSLACCESDMICSTFFAFTGCIGAAPASIR